VESYKFSTKIDNDGKIELPDQPQLSDKQVDVIIIPKQKSSKHKISADEFVKKWSGILENKDIDRSKWNYLKDKHQLH